MSDVMERDEMIDFLVNTGRQALENQDEYIPTAVLQDAEGKVEIAVLAVEGHPVDALTQFLANHIATERRALGMVSFTCDSYMEGGSEEEVNERRDRKGTSLAERFKRGDPTVSECLMITAAFADGRDRGIMLPYIHASGAEGRGSKVLEGRGKVVWGEMKDFPAEFSGRVPHTLRTALALSQQVAETLSPPK